MAYTIYKSNGAQVGPSITDGTVDTTSTSLTLIGKNYAGYGVFLNENYLFLLENFANGAPPKFPLNGQLWFDSTNRNLKLYDTSGTTPKWKGFAASTLSTAQPSDPVPGDFWWDQTKQQLNVYSQTGGTGTGKWVLVGPAYTSTSGNRSGAIVSTILDSASKSHVVIQFYVEEVVMAIISKDSTFTPQNSIPGFTLISPGLTLVSPNSIAGVAINGIVSNAQYIGVGASQIAASSILRNDQAGTLAGSLTINNASGLLVYGTNSFQLSVDPATQAVSYQSKNANSDLNFLVTSPSSGSLTPLKILGANGRVSIPLVLASTSATTGALVVGGGVGIGGALNTTGAVSIADTTASTTTTTGALKVAGGAGIGGAITSGGILKTTAVTTSLNATTGALVVAGGAGIGGEVHIGSAQASTSASTGALVVTGGVGIGGTLNATIGVILSTQASTTTTSGALIVNGGVGISGNLNTSRAIGLTNVPASKYFVMDVDSTGNLTVYSGPAGAGLSVSSLNPITTYNTGAMYAQSPLIAANTTPSVSSTTGGFLSLGGAGITGNLNVSGNITASHYTSLSGNVIIDPIGANSVVITASTQTFMLSTTNATSATSGALVVSGGIGVAQDIWATGAITAYSGNLTVTSGAVNIGSGPVNMTSGNLTLTSGNINLSSGNLNVTLGSINVPNGTLTVSNFGVNSSNVMFGAGSQRGVISSQQYYVLNSAVPLNYGIGDQRIFNTNVFLAASTIYGFETSFQLNKPQGATSHTVAFNLGTGVSSNIAGVAGVTWVNYQVSGSDVASVLGGLTLSTTSYSGYANITSNVTISPAVASASASAWYNVTGTIAISTSGWITPRVSFSANAGGMYFTQPGSYMRIWPIGSSGANIAVGSWA